VASIAWETVENALRAWVAAASGLPDSPTDRRVIWAQQAGPRPNDPWISLNVTSVLRVGQDWTDKKLNTFTFSKAIAAVDATQDSLDVGAAHGLGAGDGPLRLVKGGGATLPAPLAEGVDYWASPVNADALRLSESFLEAVTGAWIDLTSVGSGTNTLVSTSATTHAGRELTRGARGMRVATMSIQCFGVAPQGSSSAMAIMNDVVAAVALPAVKYALRQAGVGIAQFGTVTSIGQTVSETVFEPRSLVEVTFHLASNVEEVGTYIQRAEIEDDAVSPPRSFVVEAES
jgi:hypothetical protein